MELLNFAEGREQDRKADLIAAFRKIATRKRRKHPTDLHVRELLTFILHNQIGDEGVKLSYNDIADRLECEPRTARTIVERAVKEFRLVEPIEQRYASDAQQANLYKILWPVVRYTLATKEELDRAGFQSSPPATQCQGGATQCQGGATQWQPTTLTSSLTNSLKKTTTTDSSRTAHETGTAWSVVVVALKDCGVAKDEEAIEGAKRLGFTPEHCMALVNLFRELPEERRTPGMLYRWFTMARSAPKLAAAREQPAPRRSKFDREKVRIEAYRQHRLHLLNKHGGPLTDEQWLEVDQFAELTAAAAEAQYRAQTVTDVKHIQNNHLEAYQ